MLLLVTSNEPSLADIIDKQSHVSKQISAAITEYGWQMVDDKVIPSALAPSHRDQTARVMSVQLLLGAMFMRRNYESVWINLDAGFVGCIAQRGEKMESKVINDSVSATS